MASFSPLPVFPAGGTMRPLGLTNPTFALGDNTRPIAAVASPPPPQGESPARHWRRDWDEVRSDQMRHARADLPGALRRHKGHTWSREPSGSASSLFLVRLLDQQLGTSTGAMTLRSDGPALGSQAYRQAGGEPAIYGEQPRLLRIAV